MDRLRRTVRQRGRQRGEAAVDGFGNGLCPCIERVLEQAKPTVEGFGDGFGARIEGLFESLQPAVEGFGHRPGAGIEGLLERLGAGIEGLLKRLQMAADGAVEGLDLGVERGVEIGHAVAERGFELQQALIQRRGDLAAVRGQAGVEGVDIGLQAFGDILGALAHPLDDLAAEGFDGAIEFGDVAADQRAERARVAGEFLREVAALVLHQFIERAHLQRERIVRVFGLAGDLRHQRVDGDVERFAGLVAAGHDLGREAIAGIVDLADEIAAAQFEFQQERVAGILQGVVNLFGTVGNAVDDGGGALLEFAGDAVDAFVQHLMDAVGEIDELVMHVAGLEIEAGGEAFAGVEHRAGGLGAGFLEAVEQVAAALAEREDHVVAGMAQRTGDVGATLFERTGDALGDFVDARCDGVRDQRDVVAQVDLHAGNGAANLFGLADQIVALMRDVLQQRADAHFIVAVGALEGGDFVGNEGFELAGACDRAFDAVTHRRDFTANRLADGDHGVAGGTFGLGKTNGNLRHRLRDHAQFLAAPGKGGEEIKQQHRCEEQRHKSGQRQHAAAALADRGLQRGQEGEGQQSGADQPDHGEQRCERKGTAGRAALLDGLQDLPDGFAIVIGGASGRARARLLDLVEDRPVGALPVVEGRFVVGGRRRTWRHHVVTNVVAIVAAVVARHVADVQGFLNGRKRDFGRVFDLLGVVRHVQSEPSLYFLLSGWSCASLARSRPVSSPAVRKRDRWPACPLHPQTSYWLSDANEMAAINTILIIVNSAAL